MNIGTTVTMGLLMLAGYTGGAAMLPSSVVGLGFNAGQAHEILSLLLNQLLLLCSLNFWNNLGWNWIFSNKQKKGK